MEDIVRVSIRKTNPILINQWLNDAELTALSAEDLGRVVHMLRTVATNLEYGVRQKEEDERG